MDKKTTGIIATVTTAVLCGCPGLLGLCFGSVFAVISRIPSAELDTFGSSDPQKALSTGLITACVSIIFIAIPIVVGIITLRKKSTNVIDAVNGTPIPAVEPSQPLPPQPPAIDATFTSEQPAPGETLPPKPADPSNPEEPLPPAI